MRVFLAIPADAIWSDSARRLTGRLKAASPPASWTRPESWHLTLTFLGEILSETADRFAASIDGVLARTPAGSLSASGAVVLPPRGRPRVLGIGFVPSSTALAPLSELARAAEHAFRQLGGSPESRPFHPHVTFARVRQPWPPEAIESYRREADAWAFPDWPVRSCVLYESRLAASGAVHTPLREWTLATAPAAVRA